MDMWKRKKAEWAQLRVKSRGVSEKTSTREEKATKSMEHNTKAYEEASQ